MHGKLTALAVALVLFLHLPIALRAAEIPLGMTGNIYTVSVQINRAITMDFMVDPGAGVVVIPVNALRHLMQIGSVTEADMIGIGTAALADSSLYLTATVKLRELRIGNVAVPDVTAAVSPGLSQPLLGQSFLRRFASVTFDNRRRVLVLSDDVAGSAAQPPAMTWVAPYPSYPAPAPYSGGGYAPRADYSGYGR